MAPSPQETMVNQKEIASEIPQGVPRPLTGEEVVISGMSGIFPKSASVLEFMNNLYNKVDMITHEDSRWNFNHPEVPKHLGKVDGMGKFDAQFFRVHYKQACTMEPMSRKLLEHAYSAIYDSGINPLQLRGKKVGVFIGSTFSESEKIVIYENIQRNGFGITGCNKAMYANRISYWIDGKGPSYALDLACASSMACLEHAHRCISTGQCDAAIVGGSNLCVHPNVSLMCRRSGFLCSDGKTKCFDKNGEGYVRSDAISVLFLQKARDAKRIYSEVYHAKGNYSSAPNKEFLPIRESMEIQQFLETFYSEIDVSPNEVEYVEANGAAIAEADGNELEAMANFFAKDNPIKIGSVKSNMGSSEPASGACALTKVCLAYHQGKIPANLHYNEPQDHIPAVRDGRVQVLTENAPFNRGFTALNSFSYSGANIHVLLKGHYKPKDPERYKSSIPYLLLVSGRQDFCVKNILKALKNSPIDAEQIGLLHSIHESDIPGHMCRGYSILDTNEMNETVCLSQSGEYSPGTLRPLWFVYSGMGSQWAGMGAQLMRIPIFSAAIEKCHRVLEPKGVDIVTILTDPDKTIFDNILHSFVGIAAVQIGLTDILREMGIVPDNIIGHSVGELGCAYADGCFTAEEMILSAYSRGLVSVQTPLIRGSMAAVGLGYKAILAMCPPEIEVACHNSTESSTISGPSDIIKQFVAELTGRGIFAKEVACSNIAYHSRYIVDAGPGLLKYLSEVIKDPKPRSEKWVSTSVPQDNWDDLKAKYSSAEYHTNNLLNSVLFEETSKLIPANALVIEIAPHGLLQAILKRSFSECVHIPLTRREHADPVKFLLEGIGKLYQAGLNPKVDVLYPRIEFPVATETPLLSHLVEWEHSEDWPKGKYNTKDRVMATVRELVMSIHDDDYNYFADHVRDGVYVFPEAAFLVLIWETLAMHKGIEYKDLSVIFRDVQFHGEATITTEAPLRLGIMINKGNNKFEVSYENVPIVSGYVNKASSTFVNRNVTHTPADKNDVILSAKDVYTIMKLRGYCYKNKFESIHLSNASRNKASIKWSEEWIPFLDSLIQLNAFARNHNGISTPKIIKRLIINIEEHKKAKKVTLDDVTCLNAELYDIYEHTTCGGVQIDGIVFKDQPLMELEPDILQSHVFVPHFLTGNIDLKTALEVNFQVIANNVADSEIKVIEYLTSKNQVISETIKGVTDEVPTVNFTVKSIPAKSVDDKEFQDFEEAKVIVIENLLDDEKKMSLLNIAKNSFVLTLEKDTTVIEHKYKQFNIISAMYVQTHVLVLLNKADFKDDHVTYIKIAHDSKFAWVSSLRSELEKTGKVVLVSERQPYCGLLGLVKKMRKEYENRISLFLVDDFYHVPSFNPDNIFFKEQLQKNLTFNVMKKGQWGGYYDLSSTTSTKSTNFQNVYLTGPVPGNLDCLTWTEALLSSASNKRVQVCYASPSFRDAQNAAGNTINKDKAFGMDFSGIDNRGQRVMGVVSGGSLGSIVEADADLLWPVPEHWTLEDAATVPLPYLHAYYCLTVKTQLRRGNTVLINGGAGALGQAIISICLDLGCEVFTTVSDVKKKEFLLKRFPQLKETHVGNSQAIVFQDMVMVESNKSRCDIVINSLSGNLRKAAMKCVGSFNVFLDVGDCDMAMNNDFGMYFLGDATNYCAVQLSSIFRPEYAEEKKILQMMISEGIAKGVVRPLTRVIYMPADVSRAFRLLSTSRHRGKVLIKMRVPENMNQNVKVIPKITYSSTGTYIVVCDDSPLSFELVDRMIKRGATNFVVHIKANRIAGYCFTKLVSWRKLNVTIRISSENLQTEKGCMNLLKDGKKIGPLLGIFVIHNFTTEVTEESFEAQEFAANFNKVACVVANLDLMSRNTCNDLKHFVILSYSPRSAADEYVVSTIDKICQSRNEITLPALVFRTGLIKELNPDVDSNQMKVQPQSLSDVFSALECSLKLMHNNVVTYNLRKRADNNFIDRLLKIIGVNNIDLLKDNYTLNDLIVNEINIQEIITAIKDEYKICYSVEKVKTMTIESLKNLGRDIVRPNSNFDGSLGAFFTFIDVDECLATEPMVTMRTKFSSITEEDELDPEATYLMLIPGFEGHHQIFTSLCERLKVQAMTLQLGPDLNNETIQEMASNISKFTKKRCELKSKFYLLGYSFGVNVALELAALFEKEGHVGIVYCLDSSPDVLRIQLDAYIGNLTDSQLQSSIVEHMYRLMTGKASEELKKDLERNENWADKIEACVNRLRGLVNYSNQYKRSILQQAYRRIMLAREYKPDFKLESELVLMKGIPHPKAEGLTDDYNLCKYTKRPVKVFNIESDHALASQDCKVANVVNKLLEPRLLEEFKKKNLCESYLADPFKIL